jgi:hypothetical protein
MQRGTALEVVVLRGLVIGPTKHKQVSTVQTKPVSTQRNTIIEKKTIHLLSTENQPLLNRRDTLFLLDTLLYPRDLAGENIFSILARQRRDPHPDVRNK